MVAQLPIPTPDGVFLAAYSERGLCALSFPGNSGARRSAPVPAQLRGWHAETTAALRLALAGEAPQPLPPLDLSAGTEFQQLVWQALRQIPLGRTWTYAQVAGAIGRPKALRAVGSACGANPIPVFIPCHRVVACGGRIGGFSSGLKWKRLLLSRESGSLQLAV